MTRRTRVPHVAQYSQSECGLCCAAMVLGHHGRRGVEHRLRADVDTGRDGLSLAAVAALLREHGMEVDTFQATVRGLRRLDLPVIVYWQDRHLVVLERLDDRGATVVDPAVGRRRLSLQEFSEGFSALAIRARPGLGFSPVREPRRRVWPVLLGDLRGVLTRPLTLVTLASLALYSLVLGLPLATERLIDGTFPDLPVQGWLFVAVVVLVPLLTHLAVAAGRASVMAGLTATLGAELMRITFDRLIRLPYRYFATRSQGELMYRLGSLTQVCDAISGQLMGAVLDLGTLAVALVYVFSRSAPLGGVTLGLVVVIATLNVTTFRTLRSLTDREIGETATASGVQMEAISSIVAVRTSGMSGQFFTSWWDAYRRATEIGRRRTLLQGLVAAGVSTLQVFGPFLILVAGLHLVTTGALELGVVVAAQALSATALGTTTSLSATFMQFIRVHSQITRVGDIVLREPDEAVFAAEGPDLELSGRLRVEALTFTYPGAVTPALRDVSFQADVGSRIAVVGASGSGKSTLGKVLVGLYAADGGRISVDDVALADLTEESFRRAVAYVPQDVTLSNRTIAENIDFSAGDPDPEVVLRAAAAAQVLPDIQRMPLGFHTEVRELGANLSGGQRQRIAVARALARRPSLLVLDEATSALDAHTEARLTAELERLECTQIVIAHRLSTVRTADTVVVLQDGAVVQCGDPRELMHRPGAFRDLLAHQAAADDPEGTAAAPDLAGRTGQMDMVLGRTAS